MRRTPTWLLAAALIGAACWPTPAQARAKFTFEESEIIEKRWPEARQTSTGLRYIVVKEGSGPLPRPGDRLKVLFRGMFLDGKVFDQALDPEAPFTFRLERGEVILGWDEALGQMKRGEKRILITPHSLAYGTRGRPPSIPRSTPLVFEVELLDFGPP
jgi:FKBP-type peptidyl-prolyl cis-trans isomerase